MLENGDIIIQDEFGMSHRLQPGDPLYSEAKQTGATMWPLAKLVTNRGWGWWTVQQKVDDFLVDLGKMVPPPGRLIAIDKEYTPTELQDLLQQFGSYAASLHSTVGMLEAQVHGLRESYKAGMQVATQSETGDTKTSKESKVLATNELFRQTRRLLINNEACLLAAKGWLNAYEAAYGTVSRLITLLLGETSLSTGRHP